MAKCVVPTCKGTNRELFCPPDDKVKLRKWKQILNIKELNENYLICDLHFEGKFIGNEKFLLPNAFPSRYLSDNCYRSNESCESCLKKLEISDPRIIINERLQKIFQTATTHEVFNKHLTFPYQILTFLNILHTPA